MGGLSRHPSPAQRSAEARRSFGQGAMAATELSGVRSWADAAMGSPARPRPRRIALGQSRSRQACRSGLVSAGVASCGTAIACGGPAISYSGSGRDVAGDLSGSVVAMESATDGASGATANGIITGAALSAAALCSVLALVGADSALHPAAAHASAAVPIRATNLILADSQPRS